MTVHVQRARGDVRFAKVAEEAISFFLRFPTKQICYVRLVDGHGVVPAISKDFLCSSGGHLGEGDSVHHAPLVSLAVHVQKAKGGRSVSLDCKPKSCRFSCVISRAAGPNRFRVVCSGGTVSLIVCVR